MRDHAGGPLLKYSSYLKTLLGAFVCLAEFSQIGDRAADPHGHRVGIVLRPDPFAHLMQFLNQESLGHREPIRMKWKEDHQPRTLVPKGGFGLDDANVPLGKMQA